MTEESLNMDKPQAERLEPSAASVDVASASTGLTEDLALAQLKDPDVTSEVIEQISRDSGVMRSRKVRMGIASHSRTPRRIALRVIRDFYTFELAQFALMPVAPADLKRVADESLLGRLASITLGERISLARRSSALVAGGLLLDKEPRVWQTALDNPRLTEAGVVKALQKAGASRALVEAVCYHAKWSLRNEVQIALLRNAHVPVSKAIEFARRIPRQHLKDILHASKLPENIKRMLRAEADGTDGQ